MERFYKLRCRRGSVVWTDRRHDAARTLSHGKSCGELQFENCKMHSSNLHFGIFNRALGVDMQAQLRSIREAYADADHREEIAAEAYDE